MSGERRSLQIAVEYKINAKVNNVVAYMISVGTGALYFFLAHESRKLTIRLNTKASAVESTLSKQK